MLVDSKGFLYLGLSQWFHIGKAKRKEEGVSRGMFILVIRLMTGRRSRCCRPTFPQSSQQSVLFVLTDRATVAGCWDCCSASLSPQWAATRSNNWTTKLETDKQQVSPSTALSPSAWKLAGCFLARGGDKHKGGSERWLLRFFPPLICPASGSHCKVKVLSIYFIHELLGFI